MDAEYPCYLISRQFQSRSAGCSANTIGVSGTLNWRSTRRMCRSLRVEGRRLMDMGAGDGQFMVSALANGARMVMGCEHPQNHAQQWILLSVLEGMAQVFGWIRLRKYNAIKLMFAGGVCGAAQTAFIHACGWQFRSTSTT